MLRFLLTPRWVGLLLAALVVAVVCVQLGRWQFHRYHDRQDDNAVTRANLAATAVPVAQVMAPGRPLGEDDEWKVVQAVGEYDPGHTITVRYRTRDGAPGADVVVPLVTSDGTALLVDRGWVETAANATEPVEVPAPPEGEVTVTGWARPSATGSETVPADGSVRAVSSDALAGTMPYPLFDGFVESTSEDPAADPSPTPAEPPDLSSGPHFFYGLQWYFFAMLAVGFWGYFAWSEHRERTRARDGDGRGGATAPPDGEGAATSRADAMPD